MKLNLSLFKRDHSELINSQLHDEHSFFKSFSRDFKSAKNSVIIESPFMTKRRASELAPLCGKLTSKRINISIYTRNPSDHDAGLREQACIATKILRSAGANVIWCHDMRHRKLAIIDGQILWEGSLYMLSHSNSREIMRRTDSKSMSAEMLKFISYNR